MENKKIIDVMIDIESLSTDVDAIICSIAACVFNVTNKTVDTENMFYMPVNWSKQMGERHLSSDTLKFWLGGRTSQTAKNELLVGTKPLYSVLQDFKSWYWNLDPKNNEIFVWSKGSHFDFPILHHAFRQYSINTPWSYQNVMDSRTFVRRMLLKYPDYKFQHINTDAHSAKEDVIHQAYNLIECLQFLNLGV